MNNNFIRTYLKIRFNLFVVIPAQAGMKSFQDVLDASLSD